jgi:hypothetical protein
MIETKFVVLGGSTGWLWPDPLGIAKWLLRGMVSMAQVGHPRYDGLVTGSERRRNDRHSLKAR